MILMENVFRRAQQRLPSAIIYIEMVSDHSWEDILVKSRYSSGLCFVYLLLSDLGRWFAREPDIAWTYIDYIAKSNSISEHDAKSIVNRIAVPWGRMGILKRFFIPLSKNDPFQVFVMGIIAHIRSCQEEIHLFPSHY